MPVDAQFINRSSELEKLRLAIEDTRETNKIVFLTGPSGIGKSALARKVLESEGNRPAIRVEVVAGTYTEGFYLSEIARALDSEASSSLALITLQSFLQRIPTPEMRRLYNHTLLSSVSTSIPVPLAKAVGDIIERKVNWGMFDPDRIFRSTESDAVLMLHSYVHYILSKTRLVLDIENAQAIDHASLRLLSESLKTQTGQFIILEYTTDKPNLHSLDDLKRRFEATRSDIRHFPLRKLPFGDVLKLIDNDEVTRLLQRAYVSYNGNLRQLRDLDLLVSAGSGMPSFDLELEGSTGVRLESLSKRLLMTLSFVASHQGKVSHDLLRILQLYTSPGPELFLDFDQSLNQLTALEILLDNGHSVFLAHDSYLYSILASGIFERYLVLANEAWARLYQRLYRDGDYTALTKMEVLFQLFHFSLQTDSGRLFDVMDDIKAIAINSLYPRSTLALLDRLRESTTAHRRLASDVRSRITFSLLDVYYALGLFKEALDTLDSLSESSDLRKDLYRAALLDRLDRHREAIEFIRDKLSTKNSWPAWCELSLKLILMTSHRSLNEMTQCEIIFKSIRKTRQYRDVPEYGYFLRNAEIVLAFEASLSYLQQSIDWFRRFEMPSAEGHSHISLAMNLARLGSLDAAMREIDLAEQALAGKTMERHVILNDRAAILLHTENLSNAPEELLNSALVTVTTSFDKIIILTNLLIARSLRGILQHNDELEGELLSALNEQPDRYLHRHVFFNLAYYAQLKDDKLRCTKFMDLARDVGDEDNYWEFRLRGGVLRDSNYLFLSRFPFAAGFISYWHFPIRTVSDRR
jgi:hypothetical protein